jgi:hypothetical protein
MATFSRGYHTESAGTAIVEVIPAAGEGIPTVNGISYTCAATAHNLYIMRAVGQTTTVQGALSGATTIVLAKTDPGKATTGADETLAANDYLVWADEVGVYKHGVVSSLSGNTITLGTALASDLNAGTTVWVFHEIARSTHIALKPPASTTTAYNPVMFAAGVPRQYGVNFSRTGVGEPLLVVADNLTNAGSINYISGYYSDPTNTNQG